MDSRQNTDWSQTSASWERLPTRRMPVVQTSPPTLREEIEDGLERALQAFLSLRRSHPWVIPGSLVTTALLGLLGFAHLISGDRHLAALSPSPEGSRQTRSSRRGPRVDRETASQRLREVARACLREPTRAETFPPRWEALKVYVDSLDRSARLERFPPEVMAELRIAAYRSPEEAAPRLDELLAQAGHQATLALPP